MLNPKQLHSVVGSVVKQFGLQEYVGGLNIYEAVHWATTLSGPR